MPSHQTILDTLQENLASVFEQTQLTVANHRKNCVSLFKIHLQSSTVTQVVNRGAAVKLIGERSFGDAFIDMVNRVLVVKKGATSVDRIVRFIGEYVKFMNEKVCEQKEKGHTTETTTSAEEEDDDTFASRFVARLLKWLFQGFTAKNKIVRFRSVQITSEMISYLGEIDEDLYSVLRANLIERVSDKESLIRSHAVVALSKLAGSEDPREVEQDEQTILEVLLDVLRSDPAAEVRRAALLHIPLSQSTAPDLLSRTRDTDPLTRKLVYASVLQKKLPHPRQLTIAQREQVVTDGLGDREPGVRVAAGKTVAAWFDTVFADEKDTQDGKLWIGDDGGVMRAFIGFLHLFDVVGPGEGVAADALLSIFVTRPGLLDVFIFDDHYWKELTPESALLARVFAEHCLSNHNDALLESASLPVVTAFAFHVQEAYNSLLGVIQNEEESRLLGDVDDDDDNDDRERLEDDIAKAEVILAELLRIAVNLDYSDEIGRRKVFAVVKDMLAHEGLAERLIDPCLDVLAKISPTERELIRVVVEVVLELRDDGDGDESDVDLLKLGDQSDVTRDASQRKERSLRRSKERHEMTPEEALRADIVDIRCLNLCIGMLERVHGSFEDNSTLEGVLADLIIPAVKRKELVMREKGLVSLGLCCLIAKNMALNSFQLFLNQAQSSPDELKLKVLQVIFDLLIMYEHEFFGRSADIAERIISFLLQTLESQESDRVQAVLCIGLTKLLISGVVTDPKILITLVLAYVSPATKENLQLRQCLSYFFPVYCYSSPENRSLMHSIFMTTFDQVTQMQEDLEDDQVMIEPYQFGLLFIDWTNPQRMSDQTAAPPTQDGQVDMAVNILKALYSKDYNDVIQKNLCQLLGHLHLPPELDPRSALRLQILISNLPDLDKPAEKLMNQFENKINKLIPEERENDNDKQRYMKDAEIRALYEFVGMSIPCEDETEVVSTPPRSHASKSRPGEGDRHKKTPSPDVEDQADDTSSSSEDEALRDSSPTPSMVRKTTKGKGKATANARSKGPRRRKPEGSPSQSPNRSQIGEDENEDSHALPPATPKKKGAKRVRTPGSKRSLMSPLRKKPNRGGVSTKKPVRSKQDSFSVTITSVPKQRGRKQVIRRKGAVADHNSGVRQQESADDNDKSEEGVEPDGQGSAILDSSSDDLIGYSEDSD